MENVYFFISRYNRTYWFRYYPTVNGTIGARRVIVETTDWCDYVFANDYQLMPLDEVESFVQKNNHLPEIPSEKDVIENGHDLAKTNKLLLKKVEELTLYMLQMNKRVAQLEHENQQFKK